MTYRLEQAWIPYQTTTTTGAVNLQGVTVNAATVGRGQEGGMFARKGEERL